MSRRLSDQDRIVARRKLQRAAKLAYRHRGAIHYTQSAARWQGINRKDRAYLGEYPNYADCSSFVTWLYWDALKKHINKGEIGDILNGANWKAGYTGTLLRHGREINKPSLIGDLVIYGRRGSTGAHVAMYIGNGLVISHGSEGGPYIVPWKYRSDVQSVRRYL